MPRARSARSRSLPRARCTPVTIARHCNFPGRRFRGKFWRDLAREVRRFPGGSQKPWGIPFKMADYVCVLHTFRKSDTDRAEYIEAAAVGEYELHFTDGTSQVRPIRARLDVPVPESPGPAQMAVPFHMPLTLDPVVPPVVYDGIEPNPHNGSNWGARQTGIDDRSGGPLLYAFRNPKPGKTIKALVIRGLVESPLIVAGVTAYRGSDHPLRHLARRMYRVRAPGRKPPEVKAVEVDMGAVARVDRTIGPRGKGWLKSPYTGATLANEPEKSGEDVFSIYGAYDATVSVRLANRKRPVEFSLGRAYESGVSRQGRVRLERLGGVKRWVQVEIIDGSTGAPTPARIHISGPAGEYIAPYGHHEQVNDNWFEDYGADLKVAGRSYAYVPGVFTTDLPTGDLYIELYKGFEYTPKRCKVTLRPGQRKLTLRINRWKDLRREGWVTADTHVHFLSPQTAWLQAQCEGVNVVNLLASQWGRLFTNVGDISGRLGVVEDDTVVWVGTENRNHMLGHISMLGTKGLPVFPMCAGGVGEAWVGDPDYRTLTEWAAECKEKDGVVIRPHFPYCGFTEDPVLAVTGVVDALEIRVGPNARFPLQEWYRYLNNGYRVAVAGGTDKMGAYCPLGNLRTYARIARNRPFTYENWAQAVRAGRTFATTGPLMDLAVEGRTMGESIRLPA
ncbi:MAG: CehA/McbA family metallohydrolase, partial [Planctomycetota bacterium]